MRPLELDQLLSTMLQSQKEVSDLNFTTEKALQVESNGELVSVSAGLANDKLTPYQTETIAINLLGGSRRLIESLVRTGSSDSSYSLGDKARFRVNVFSQRGQYSIVMRKLNTNIPTMAQLKMPPIFEKIAQEENGIGPDHRSHWFRGKPRLWPPC